LIELLRQRENYRHRGRETDIIHRFFGKFKWVYRDGRSIPNPGGNYGVSGVGVDGGEGEGGGSFELHLTKPASFTVNKLKMSTRDEKETEAHNVTRARDKERQRKSIKKYILLAFKAT
jgi:hypothetical protein